MKVTSYPTQRIHFSRICSTFMLVSSLIGACNDPYSRKRIGMREDNLREFRDDVRGAEARRAVRLREAEETLGRWWARDVDDYNRRMPTVGDYFW